YPHTPERSFVFGYIDMDDAPSSLDWMTLSQVAPPTDAPIWGMRISDGMFYAEVLKPGSYILEEFGSNGGFFKKVVTYGAGRQNNPVKIVINNPGVYYVGSFQYVRVSTGIFRPDAFELRRISAPSEKELLSRLLPFANGTNWDPILRTRMAAL